MQRFYVYRFKNEENEIIYVGKTKDLKQRIRTHFGKQGHLPKECYEEVRKIEFLTFENESLMYQLQSVLEKHHGTVPVVIFDALNHQKRMIDEKFWIKESADLYAELRQLLGKENVVMK